MRVSLPRALTSAVLAALAGAIVPAAPAHAQALERPLPQLVTKDGRHALLVDAARTVILVQVENEPGTWGSVRDYSPAAQALFEAPVPAELQAIGWAPFGVDYTAYARSPIARELARLSFDGKLHTAVEEKEEHTQTIDLGRWKAVVTYGVPAFGFGRDPRGNPEAVGRALVAEVGEDRFLVAGYFCRVDFQVKDGVFRPIRIWNGDETDWGLNFSSAPQVLRVSLGTY